MVDVLSNKFENLTQSGLFRLNSKDDRNVTMSIDTYGGYTSLCVFTGSGGKPWKISLPRKIIKKIEILLKYMQKDLKPCTNPIFLTRYEELEGGKKGFKQYGRLCFGIDENLTFFIDISADDLSGRHIFLAREDPRFDFSNTSLGEKDLIVSNIGSFIDTLVNSAMVAERLSAQKRVGGGFTNNKSTQGSWNNKPAISTKDSTFGNVSDDDLELHVL